MFPASSPRSRGLGLFATIGVSALCASSLIVLASATSNAAIVCTSSTPGDINGDGHADFVIGESGDADYAGAVHALYGTAAGIVAGPSGTALDDQLFTQDTPGVPGAGEAGDGFGSTTTLADLNGDGCADLAVAAQWENSGRGAITILYGSPAGLTTTGAQAFTETSLFGTGAGVSDEYFGMSLASGDFDADGIADLAVGSAGESVTPGGVDQGGVTVLYGASGGLGTGALVSTMFTQSSPGISGGPEDQDYFGQSVAAGDFNGDTADDLAIGVAGENTFTGVVQILPGTAGVGLGALPASTVSQDTPGAPGGAEAFDQFGLAIAAGDATGDGRADLAVGAIGENDGHGAVSFFPGSPTGATGTGGQIFDQDSPGIVGAASRDDFFGWSLAMEPFDNGPLADLAIGVPRDNIGAVQEAGGVNLLLGSPTGLTVTGAGQRFTQDTTGIAGTAEDDDDFGFSITGSQIQTSGQANLIVGAPFETISGVPGAGMMHQLATVEFGPNPEGSVSLTLNSAGVKGTAEPGSSFGVAID